MNDVSVAISAILDELQSTQLRVANLEDCIDDLSAALKAVEIDAVGIGSGEYSISREVLKKVQEAIEKASAP